MTSARTWLARFTVVVFMAAGLGGLALSASAHDVLISSNPVDGATLHAVPATMIFTFDQPVQDFHPVISLIGPDGKQYATGTPQISGNVVTGNVAPITAGAYIAAFRIVSADGHPVTGEVHFTLAAGAGPATGAAPTAVAVGDPAVASSAQASSAAQAGVAPTANIAAPAVKSGGLSSGIWIVLIVAALVIAAAAVILLRRPSDGASRPDADQDY